MPVYFKRFSTVLVGILCAYFFLTSPASAEAPSPGKTVRVVGTSGIPDGDTEKAKRWALSNGLVTAVDLVMLETLPLDFVSQQLGRITEATSGNIDQFIINYNVLAESVTASKCKVILKVTVSTDILKQYLKEAGILAEQKGTAPKILVMVTEKRAEDQIPFFWWADPAHFQEAVSESAIIKVFNQEGFPVIDHTLLPPDLQAPDSILLNPRPSDAEACQLAEAFGANVVIVGIAMVRETINTMQGDDVKSFTAAIEVKALRVDSCEVIGESAKSSTTLNNDNITGVNESLFSAGFLAGEELARHIVQSWQQETKPSGIVKIIVGGKRFFSNFIMFRKKLNEIVGVKDIKLSELKSDEASLQVDYEGDAAELAGALNLQSFDNFRLNIFEISDNGLKIELVEP